MKQGTRVPTARVAQVLLETYGNVTAAASALGMRRESLHRRISRSKQLREAMEEGRAQLVGEAMSRLAQMVLQGDKTAIIFVLKTWGKSEGFTERTEVDLAHPQVEYDW
jgi:hypothetical protein